MVNVFRPINIDAAAAHCPIARGAATVAIALENAAIKDVLNRKL